MRTGLSPSKELMSASLVPDWVKTGLLYHIYPLSFADSNNDGYGDLHGIIGHLPYIESLGATSIWLSPVYRSPMVDFGYDITDHCDIDPIFGTLSDFDQLIEAAHAMNIKILMDYVPNHTSDQHPWFADSRASRSSPKRDWYIWGAPQPDGSPPNNWLSVFGGSAWQLDAETGEYYLHSHLVEQPDLNWRNGEVRREMLAVLNFWLARGVDGFRTDAVRSLAKDPQLRNDIPNPNYRLGVDDPFDSQLHTFSRGQGELGGVISTFCDVLAERPDKFLVSEAYLDIPGLHELYGACKKHPLHSPFNFNLMNLPWTAQLFKEFIDAYEENLGPLDWPNYVLGNHDRHRLATRVGESKARLLTMLQLTLRGLPVIYYGDELGLPDAIIPESAQLDPWGKQVKNFDLGRDPERAPMSWAKTRYGGFSEHKPWLPMAKDHQRLNVDSESVDPTSTLNLFRHLSQLRQTHGCLQSGDYESLDCANSHVFLYCRRYREQIIIVALNFSQQKQQFTCNLGEIRPILSSVSVDVANHKYIHHQSLDALEGRIYELKP